MGFDDSAWASATVVARAGFHLFAQMAPAENEQVEFKPVSVALSNGAWLVDFGRCLDGWPKLTLRANRPGDVVRVEYFQMSGERKPAGWDQYTCHGGLETWKPDFGRHASFQVLKITGYAGKLRASDVRGIWAYCDADVAGHFHCSSKLLNAIYELCERSARQNVQQAIISVDANREQSPWTADNWNIGNVLLYNDRDTMMIDKVVRDYGRAQLPNGDFPACCPAQRSARIPEWSMYWPMLLSAWALRFDLVPAVAKSQVLATILSAGKPNLGGYGGDAFYSGVLNAGGGDFVVRDLARYRPITDSAVKCLVGAGAYRFIETPPNP